MKKLMFHSFALTVLFLFISITVQVPGKIITVKNHNLTVNETNQKNDNDRVQADPKPIVFFNNILDPEGTDNNYYFYNAYWRHVNGDLGNQNYKDLVEQMAFNNLTIPKIKIMEHQVYVFPMGENSLDYAPGSMKVIKFIRQVLDSGKRVIILGNGMLEDAGNPNLKKFFEDTLGIKDIGRREVFINNTYYPYGIYGKDETEIGLNDYITCNAIGRDGEGKDHPALINYKFFNCFKSKDESKYTTFFYIAAKIDNVMAATDSAVGIRTKLKNGARIVLWSIGSENIHFEDKSQRIIHSSLQWAMMNDVDTLAPLLDVIPGFSVDLGFLEPKKIKTRTIRLRNKGFRTLKISKVEFENRCNNEIYPIDNKGQNNESSYKTKTFELLPGAIDSIKLCYKPKEDGEIYLRTISLYTNEQLLDTSAYGRRRDITFIGTGGADDYTGSYIYPNEDYFDFDTVYVDSSKTMDLEIHNKGTDSFQISAIKVVSPDTSYEIKNIDTKKFNLAPHSFNIYNIAFKPKKEGDHIGEIQVWSNAENSTDEGYIKILLFGRSVRNPDYVPEISLPDGRFRITAAPNPAKESSVIKYSFDGGTIANLNMWLADINGNKVLSIFNSGIESGEGAVSINTAGIASGVYFIIAEIGRKSAKIPLLIVR